MLELNAFVSLALIVAGWFAFYFLAVFFKLERFGLELHPLYAMFKSTKLNALLERLGGWRPGLWRVVGNVGVVSFFGQVAFMSYLLLKNLYRFFYVPSQATPVMPLIPGVTISFSSLPLFLAAAGVVILFHELAHGVMCIVEEVEVKSAAVLVAVLTFGGAVEPDEDDMEAAALLSKLRILASGSLVNLVMGLLLIVVFYFSGSGLPQWLGSFLNWLYFLSVNLALVNMLPVYPLDGGQMVRSFLATRPDWGPRLERVTMGAFLALIGGNLVLSLIRFGLVPL